MAIYDDYMQPAFAGMKADSGNDRVESFAATAAVPFGVVVTGTGETVAAGGADTVRGISLHSHAVAGSEYAEKECVSTMTRGLCWARVTEGQAATAEGAVYFAAADGTVSDLNTGTALTNAVFRGDKITADGVDIALVELHHPFA